MVNRAAIDQYSLSAAAAMVERFSSEIVIRSVCNGSVDITALEGDESKLDLNIVSGGKVRLISDRVSNWYLV